jgi:NADH dehydrogenase (ubiquinone) 1 alpha subcomplex subunit 9
MLLIFMATHALTPPDNLRNFKYSDVHVTGAERIAKIASQAGVSRLVHVSHLNASTSSTSHFYRTKSEGEELVRNAFPSATIVRPGSMYGYEDKFLNNMASESWKFGCIVLPLIKSF